MNVLPLWLPILGQCLVVLARFCVLEQARGEVVVTGGRLVRRQPCRSQRAQPEVSKATSDGAIVTVVAPSVT